MRTEPLYVDDTFIGSAVPEVDRLSERQHEKLVVFSRFSEDLSELSTCKRRNVGCIITDESFSEVWSIGYNGPVTGFENDSCTGAEGECGCVHAEANAIVKLNVQRRDLWMIATCMPCVVCASLIANSKAVSRVFYRDTYRNTTGGQLLHRAGIYVERYS